MSPAPERAEEKEEIQLPDEQLVRDCLKGRDAAWSALIGRYKNLIFSIPIRYGFSQEDSADFPENIEMRFVPFDALGRVRVDSSQIEQVVMNLIINARDAMPDGGDILIETDNAELRDGDCGLHGSTVPGKYVLLAVSDSGCLASQGRLTAAQIPLMVTSQLRSTRIPISMAGCN
jgi:signal transduction histidine kinase